MLLPDFMIRQLCQPPFRAELGGGGEVVQCLDDGSTIEKFVGEDIDNNGVSMINPFVNESVRELDGEKIVSYGLSSYGYDIRLANEFKLFTKPNDGRIIDIKKQSADNEDQLCEYIEAESFVLPPGGFALGRSVEYFRIPRRLAISCLGKSSWARCGLIINVTPLEPEWEGHLVLELTNGTGLPIKVYANEGIAQLFFHMGLDECEVSYADRGGKYQSQTGVTGSRL